MPLKLYAATKDQFSHTYFALSWTYSGGVWQSQVVEYNRFANPPGTQDPTMTTMTRIGIVFPNIQTLLVNMPNGNNNLLQEIFAIDASGLPHVIDNINLPELQVPLSSSGIWTKGGAFWIVGMLGLNSVVSPVSWSVYKSTNFNPVTGIGTWIEQDTGHRPTLPVYAYWDGSANLISFLVSDSISGDLFLQEFNTTTNLYTARHDQIPGLTTSTVGTTLIRPTPDGGYWFLYGQPLNSPGGSAVDVRAIKLTGGVWSADTKISTNISGAVNAGAIPNTLIVDTNNAAHVYYGFQQSGGPGNLAFAQYYRRINSDTTLGSIVTIGGVASQTPFGSLGNGVVDSGFIIDGATNNPTPTGDTLIVGAFYSNDSLTNSQQPGVIRGTPLSGPSFTQQTATWTPPDSNSRLTNVFLTNSAQQVLSETSGIVLGERFSLSTPAPPGPPNRLPPPCGGTITPQPTTDVQFELRRVYCTMKPHGRIPVRGG